MSKCRPPHRERLSRLNVLLLRVGEAPDFIDLDALRLHVADFGVVEASAEKAGVLKELRYRVDRYICQARDGAHRSAFGEHREDLGALGNGELVHDVIMNFLWLRSSIQLKLTPLEG